MKGFDKNDDNHHHHCHHHHHRHHHYHHDFDNDFISHVSIKLHQVAIRLQVKF